MACCLMRKDNTGWERGRRQYYETLIGKLISLLDTITNAKSKLNPNPKSSIFALIASRKKTSHISRSKKESTRKAGKRKGDESAVESLVLKHADVNSHLWPFVSPMAIPLAQTASMHYVERRSTSMH